jgi:hypothetical protein
LGWSFWFWLARSPSFYTHIIKLLFFLCDWHITVKDSVGDRYHDEHNDNICGNVEIHERDQPLEEIFKDVLNDEENPGLDDREEDPVALDLDKDGVRDDERPNEDNDIDDPRFEEPDDVLVSRLDHDHEETSTLEYENDNSDNKKLDESFSEYTEKVFSEEH